MICTSSSLFKFSIYHRDCRHARIHSGLQCYLDFDGGATTAILLSLVVYLTVRPFTNGFMNNEIELSEDFLDEQSADSHWPICWVHRIIRALISMPLGWGVIKGPPLKSNPQFHLICADIDVVASYLRKILWRLKKGVCYLFLLANPVFSNLDPLDSEVGLQILFAVKKDVMSAVYQITFYLRTLSLWTPSIWPIH